MKEESEKVGLKLNIQKTKIITSIRSHHFIANRWGKSGNSGWLYYLGSKSTADGDCCDEIKRCLLLGRKVMTNIDSILKSRDIPLPTKVCLVKVMVFPVVMCGRESWTIKKAERRRIDAFELWCWRRLLRVLWTSSKSNQSILKEISLGFSWKKWCFLIVVLKKILEGPLDCKEVQPVHPKGDQSWIFIGRTDAEAETPILWPPDVRSWLISKDPDAGKNWRQEKRIKEI